MAAYRPTHSLLVRWALRGTPAYESTIATAFEAATTHATEARFRVEDETICRDAPGVVDRLRSEFDSSSDNGATVYRSADLQHATEVTQPLLNLTGASATGVREVCLTVDGERCLQYVPEHAQFTVSDAVASGIGTSVSETISDKPVVLLPETPLAEWTYQGVSFSVGTSLCIERERTGLSTASCYGLGKLADVTAAPETRTIHLRWELHESSWLVDMIARSVGAIASAIGPTRPKTLHFETETDFSTARESLERVVDGLHGDDGSSAHQV